MIHPKNNLGNNLAAAFSLFLFFFYFSGISHLALQLTNTTVFFGFRQAVYMSLIWLIPVLLFPKKAKMISGVIGLVLWSSSLITLGYFCIYKQEFSQSVLFIIFESNTAESSEFIAQYFKWWMLLVFAGHTFIAFSLWKRIKPLELSTKYAVIFSLLIFTFSIGLPTYKDFVLKHRSWSASMERLQLRMEPAEPWQLVIGYSEYRKQLSNMQALIYKNSQLSPVKNLKDKYADQPSTIVIVIGESTNRQHMSLYGYPRETNPKLSSIKDQLAIFTHVVSARPYTIESLEQVLTFADEENPDLVMKKPSLMNIMKQAGYKTFWITNQQTLTKRNTMLTTFSKQMDVQYYMNNSRAQNSREYDQNVFEPLKKVLSDKAQRKFIVVHLLGTHMKYDYRYPPEFDQFNDNKGITSNVDENKIKVINSYDNAVLYNDYIVYNIIKTLGETKQATMMTYFSDHGEDVYDSPPNEMLGRNEGKPTLSMYAVPFIIWNSPEWKKNHSENLNKNLNRPYSTSHFIHTWADLVGLSFEDFDAKKSIINSAFVNRPLLIGDPQIKGSLRELKQ